MNPEQKAAYDRLDGRGRGRARRAWANEQQRTLTESKAESQTMAKEKAAQDEQEFTAYANRIDEAQRRLDAQMADDPEDTNRVEAARQGIEAAHRDALKWTEADAGRAKFGDKLRGAQGRGSRSGTRQAIPDAPTYGQAPRGSTREQKEDAALDAEIRRSNNNTFRDGPPEQAAMQKNDLTRADVEFRRRYGKEADTEMQKAVDETLPPEMKGQDRFAMRHLGEQVAAANGMMPDEAISVVNEMLSSGGNYKIRGDGRVQFGAAPPVFLGRSGLLAIAGIIGRRSQQQQQGKTVANPFTDNTPAGERMAAEDKQRSDRTSTRIKEETDARDVSRREERKRILGEDYRPGTNAAPFFNHWALRPMLQFKKYAQMVTYLWVDMAKRSLDQNLSRAERYVALKQFANLAAVQIAAAGALSLPGLEIVKLLSMVAAAFGIGGGYDDLERKLRRVADESLGKTWGELVTRGVISRAIGIDLSNRMSFNDLWTGMGEPEKYNTAGITSYIGMQVLGAPGTYVLADVPQAMQALQKSDLATAAIKAMPVKLAADIARAWKGANDETVRLGPVEAASTAFGLKPARVANIQQQRGDEIAERRVRQDARYELVRAYRAATKPGERIRLTSKIREYNKTVGLRDRIFPKSLDKHRTTTGAIQ